MTDKEIQRVILQFAFDHQHDHSLRVVMVKDIIELRNVEVNRLRHCLLYLKNEDLIETMTGDLMMVRLANPGINLIEDKDRFNSLFPIVVAFPEETKKMILSVENLLQGKHNSVLEQFRRSVKFLYEDKPPDSLNSVKEAVGAVEALAKILMKQPSSTLGELARPLTSDYMNHPAMQKVIDGIYGVASDVPGVRHGAYRKANFGRSDAEFILNVTASIILYLMKDEQSA